MAASPGEVSEVGAGPGSMPPSRAATLPPMSTVTSAQLPASGSSCCCWRSLAAAASSSAVEAPPAPPAKEGQLGGAASEAELCSWVLMLSRIVSNTGQAEPQPGTGRKEARRFQLFATARLFQTAIACDRMPPLAGHPHPSHPSPLHSHEKRLLASGSAANELVLVRQGLDRPALLPLPPLPEHASWPPSPPAASSARQPAAPAAGCRSPSASATCSSRDRWAALMQRPEVPPAAGQAGEADTVKAAGMGSPSAAATASSSDACSSCESGSCV